MYRYKYYIDSTEIKPINGDSLSVKFSEENYYRLDLSEPIEIIRDNYDIIDSEAFDHVFELKITRALNGGSFSDWWIGEFKKTNCKFDPDSKSILITADVNDRYKLLLEGLEKEFDLVQLAPNRYKLKYIKQAVWQVYPYPSNYVTNIVRGNSWEQRVDLPLLDNVELAEKLWFGNEEKTGTILFVPGSDIPLNPDVSGSYDYDDYQNGVYEFISIGYAVHDPSDVPFTGTGIPNDDPAGYANLMLIHDACTIDDFDDFESVWSIGGTNYDFLGIHKVDGKFRTYWRAAGATPPASSGTITHVSGGVTTASQTYQSSSFRANVPSTQPPSFSNGEFFLRRWGIYAFGVSVPISTGIKYLGETKDGPLTTDQALDQQGALFHSTTSGSKCRLVAAIMHTRLLTDEQVLAPNTFAPVGGTPQRPQVSDIVPAEIGYKYAFPVDYIDFDISDAHNGSTRTRFGRFNETAANYAGEYFGEFLATNQTIPINRADWKEASLWWERDPDIDELIQIGSTDQELRHVYKLSEVISVLLNEVDPSLTFLEDTNHSEFLFSPINPISGVAEPELFITPKSNVVVGEYDSPAEKAPIRLQWIFQMLYSTYRLKPHVDSSNRLRFEHVEWYAKGGSYSTDQIGIDLTSKTEPKTGQSWSKGQNKFYYDIEAMPEQVIFKWMDNVSEPFNGFPIENISTYVQKGLRPENIVQQFTTDLDYMQAEGGVISKDGFALLGAFEDDGIYTVPFKEITLSANRIYDIQNGYLSFIYLHDKFWRHQMASEDANLNLNDITATSVKKNKVQELELPEDYGFDPIELVTTDLGNGKIKEGEYNLSNGFLTLTMKHDN